MKEFLESVERGWALDAVVIREAIIQCDKLHIFYVNTEGSRANNVNYFVSVSEFPCCTCEGFQKMESKKLVYVPCKHMYNIFLKVLGLDANACEFMH